MHPLIMGAFWFSKELLFVKEGEGGVDCLIQTFPVFEIGSDHVSYFLAGGVMFGLGWVAEDCHGFFNNMPFYFSKNGE